MPGDVYVTAYGERRQVIAIHQAGTFLEALSAQEITRPTSSTIGLCVLVGTATSRERRDLERLRRRLTKPIRKLHPGE